MTFTGGTCFQGNLVYTTSDLELETSQVVGPTKVSKFWGKPEKSAFRTRGFANLIMILPKLTHIQLTQLSGQTYPSKDYLFQCVCKVVDTY